MIRNPPFAAFVGRTSEVRGWENVVASHAAWVGAQVRTRSTPLGQDQTFAWSWLVFAARPAKATAVEGDLLADAGPDAVRVRLDHALRRVQIDVPYTTPEQIFYTEVDGALHVTTDFRLLIRAAGLRLDPTGLLALAMLGAIPAPRTLCAGIHRIPPGHTLTVESERLRTSIAGRPLALPASLRAADPVQAEGAVMAALDASILRAPSGSLVLFSGGVDSALIAARLARHGRRDVSLVQYGFGPDDPEPEVAAQIAAVLDLRMHRLVHEPDDVEPALAAIGREYSYPFADFSAIPTSILVRESLRRWGPAPAVLEGTGADGAFAVGLKAGLWERVYRVPRALRAVGAALLGARVLRPWRYGRRLDLAFRTAKRSADWTPAFAGVAPQGTLDGIAFAVSTDTRAVLAEDLRRYVEGLLGDEPLATRMSFVDLVHVCAGQFAAKSLDPLRSRGVTPIYPFLAHEMMATSLAIPWDVKCAGGEAKALLKRVLARDVPRSLVYRPKKGFQPPLKRMLKLPGCRERVARALDERHNPLVPYHQPDVLRQIAADILDTDRPVAFHALCLLWVNLFLTEWLDQIRLVAERRDTPASG